MSLSCDICRDYWRLSSINQAGQGGSVALWRYGRVRGESGRFRSRSLGFINQRSAGRDYIYRVSAFYNRSTCGRLARVLYSGCIIHPCLPTSHMDDLDSQMRARQQVKERKMNSDILKGNWKQLKGEIQKQWGELTNDDVDVVQGNYEKLVGRVQERYGYDRETAEKEVSDYFDRMPTR
jgi:uncharacterized protein YjbJ (UPF0337 family)